VTAAGEWEAMKVRILKPAKTAMQSGQANTREWLLESEPMPKGVDPLMGWTSSRDTMQQVQLWFPTLDEAKAHAEKNGWQYTVEMPRERPVRPKAYADNFAYNRVGRWTH
jgi:ETC complex I subunit conserved region